MSSKTQDMEPIQIWKEFLNLVSCGELHAERIQPIDPEFRGALVGFVKVIQESLLAEMLDATPEIYRVEDKVHFLLPLGQERRTFTFTFLVDGQGWKFHHAESLLLDLRPPLDLPRNTFPDLPADQKAWVIAEFQVTEQIRLFNFLAEEKGEDFAFQWFQDGAGYTMAARVWIPYHPAPQAFILFMCWEQANLRGSQVTLQILDDHHALIDFKPSFFELYQRTGHLKTMISFENYRRLFETIWKDRAQSAGWELEITYPGDGCQMKFSNHENHCP